MEHDQQEDEDEDEPPGGYNVMLVSAIPRKYKCPLCKYLMRSPIQTYRGEMACESCYVAAVKKSSGLCPIDQEEIETQNNEMFFQDNHARREVLQLQCYCYNWRNRCQWIGTIGDLENHAKWCRMKPMQCPYECGQMINMEKAFQHIEQCLKIKKEVVCPYSIVGCAYQPSNPTDLQNHMIKDAQKHAAGAIILVTTLSQKNKTLQQELLREQNLQVEMAKSIDAQKEGNTALMNEVKKIKDGLNNIQQEGLAVAQACDHSDAKIRDDMAQIDRRIQQENLEGMQRNVDEVKAKFDELEARIRSGASNEGSYSEEIRQITQQINGLETGSEVLSANLVDLELKFQLFENTSYAGKLLWKVDNVTYRMNEAVIGRVTALHSAPCLQNKGGYKFCIRLYLNGDGMGRETHVSLFFVLMKSEHDDLLKWPFSERVTFRLINPYNKEESQEESFIPDPNSSSFKRPTKDMNIAAGCPMFLKKYELPQFILDDVIYIECSIGNEGAAN